MVNNSSTLEGGCLCGAVRYQCQGKPDWVGHCHCWMCKKHSGSAFLTFVLFMGRNRVNWLKAFPGKYITEDGVERGFCSECGSTISFSRPDREEVSVLAGSLDNPNEVEPMHHIFTEQKCTWVNINDNLPTHLRFPPEGVDRDI